MKKTKLKFAAAVAALAMTFAMFSGCDLESDTEEIANATGTNETDTSGNGSGENGDNSGNGGNSESGSGTEETNGSIFSGSNDFGHEWSSETALQISADKLAALTTSSTITIEYTTGSYEHPDYGVFSQIKMCSGAEGWAALTGGTFSEANEYNCITVSGTKYVFSFVESDLTEVKTNGWVIAGYNLTITKISAVTSTAEVAADKVLWEKESAQEFTTSGYDIYLDLGEIFDLSAYKYLNIEAYCPDRNSCNIALQPMSGAGTPDTCGHPQGNIIISSDASTVSTNQTKFGTFYGSYTDWSTGSAVEKEITDNNCGSIQIYAQQTVSPWGTEDGIKVYVKKITATNTKLN